MNTRLAGKINLPAGGSEGIGTVAGTSGRTVSVNDAGPRETEPHASEGDVIAIIRSADQPRNLAGVAMRRASQGSEDGGLHFLPWSDVLGGRSWTFARRNFRGRPLVC